MDIASRRGVQLQTIAGRQVRLELVDHMWRVKGRRGDARVREDGDIGRVHAVIDRDPIEVGAIAVRRRRRGLFVESISKKKAAAFRQPPWVSQLRP